MSDLPPGLFNQAIMEFGALFCKPRNPNCNECIFQSSCFAFANDLVQSLPVKKSKITISKRYFYYFLMEINENDTEYLLIRKRQAKDIWKNLYDFPMLESKEIMEPIEALAQSAYFNSQKNRESVDS